MWQNPRFGVAKGAERILPHRKKYWRSAGFRRTESSRTTKRSECFFDYANLQKIAELKSMSGLFFLLFNFALLPAFCQYNVICCAFMRFVCKYGGKVREIYSFLAVGKRGKGKALLQTWILVLVKRYANVLLPLRWVILFDL